MYTFDHQFSAASFNAPLVVLYGQLGTPEFTTLHSALAEMATRMEIQYILRHFYKVNIVIVLLNNEKDLFFVEKCFTEITVKWLWCSTLSEEYRVQSCR